VTVTDRRLTGEITDVALLDLTPMTSAEDLAGITRISDVAILLVPQSLMGAAAAIPMDDVAMVVPVPDGVEVRSHTGALVMGGEALAGPEAEHAALIVTGTLILTSTRTNHDRSRPPRPGPAARRVGVGPAAARGRADPPGRRPGGPDALGNLVVRLQRQDQHGHRPGHGDAGARARRLP
jgi:hypothetical protein